MNYETEQQDHVRRVSCVNHLLQEERILRHKNSSAEELAALRRQRLELEKAIQATPNVWVPSVIRPPAGVPIRLYHTALGELNGLFREGEFYVAEPGSGNAGLREASLNITRWMIPSKHIDATPSS